ncbi:hypothetical protein RB599_002316 [Gaeumannomyces hyphopodioides]
MSSSAAASSAPSSTLPSPSSTITPLSIYRPLDKARREICILKIAPTNRGHSVLYCSFIYASLDSNLPHYEALSYTWGEPIYKEGQVVVVVDGEPVPVRENLIDALQTLCHADAETVIWVDAICINRSDVGERNSRVAFMRDIYRGAECVLAWLGAAVAPEEEHDEELAVSHMRLLLARSERAGDTFQPHGNFNLFKLEGPRSPWRPSLFRFLQRGLLVPDRIIQELVVAVKCLVGSRASGRGGAPDFEFYIRLSQAIAQDILFAALRGEEAHKLAFLTTLNVVWISKLFENLED